MVAGSQEAGHRAERSDAKKGEGPSETEAGRARKTALVSAQVLQDDTTL